MEKISVIVPVYKVEKYLDRCVESIVNQTYKDLEIILIDDGSPDKCPQICDGWAEKDKRIKVIHKRNGGVSSARNAGLDVATGEYIQFVDSDDFLELDVCETLIEPYKINDLDFVVCGYKTFGLKKGVFASENSVYNSQIEAFQILMTKQLFCPIWNKLYKKNLIQNKFNTTIKYGEDFLFNCEYLKNCQQIKVLRYTGYNYYLFNNSAVHTYSEKCFKDHCKINDYTENVLKQRYPNYIKFLNLLKYGSTLSTFKNLLITHDLSYSAKRKILKQMTSNDNFKEIKFFQLTFKQKILYILLKWKCVFILNLMYKIKK